MWARRYRSNRHYQKDSYNDGLTVLKLTNLKDKARLYLQQYFSNGSIYNVDTFQCPF